MAFAATFRAVLRRGHRNSRSMSDFVKYNEKTLYIDTIAVAKKLEEEGLSAKHSKAVANVFAELLNQHHAKLSRTFVSEPGMKEFITSQDLSLTQMQRDVTENQENSTMLLRRDKDVLVNALEKLKSDLEYDLQIMKTNQEAVLATEKEALRDQIKERSKELNDLIVQLQKETQEVQAKLEASKYFVIKWALCLGVCSFATVVSATGAVEWPFK